MCYFKSKKDILVNIALCLCTTVLCVGVAEYTLRKIDIEGLSGHKMYMKEIGNSEYHIISPPELIIAGKRFSYDSGNCYPSDSTGLLPIKRVNPTDGKYFYCVTYDKKKRREGYNPDRKRQIALIGDSFVFGEGVKETDTLGFLLNEKYTKINFQNWGIRGSDIGYVVAQCKKIVKSEPAVDDVIYFYNLNDVQSLSIKSHETTLIIDFQNISLLKNEQKDSSLVKVLSKSEMFSAARKILLIKRKSSQTIQNYRDMYLNEKGYSFGFLLTMNYIQSIKYMLEAKGISFHMIIYPLLYKDMLGRYPFESIHQAIMKACNERGITCLDGYEPFRSYYSMKRFAVHPIDYHPNGLSNLLLVDYIHEKNFITDGQEIK